MADPELPKIPKPEGLEARLQALASERSLDADDRPGPLEAAERRAARLGVTLDELLAQDRLRVRRATYPGPECLEPYEVEWHVEGALSAERAGHLRSCAGCTALVAAATPTEEGMRDVLDELRETARRLAARRRAEAASRNRAPKPSRWRLLPVPQLAFAVVDAVVVAVSFASIVWLAVVLYPLTQRATFQPLIPMGPASLFYIAWFPAWAHADRPLAALVGVAGALLIIAGAAWLCWRLLGSPMAVLRASGGALAAGVVVGLAVGTYMWWDFGQRARASRMAVSLVQERLAGAVAESLNYKQATGRFPVVQPNPGPVALTMFYNTPDHATYGASTPDLRGSLVADIRPDGGSVYWQGKDDRPRVLAKLILGIVTAAGPDGIVLRDAEGTLRTIHTPPEWPLPKPGERVLAVVQPETNAASSIHYVNDSPAMPASTSLR